MMWPMQSILGPWLVSLKHYVYMTLLLSSPERLPYHPQAIVLNIVSYFALGLLLVSESFSYVRISGQIALQLVMMAMITQVALKRNKLQSRFVQTYSALTGITLLIDAVTIPVHLHIMDRPEMPDTTIMWIGFAILFWNLAVLSLIFRRAFEVSTPISAIISFSYFVAYHLFAFWLFK
jgi:CDP-diglyceride synthetase